VLDKYWYILYTVYINNHYAKEVSMIGQLTLSPLGELLSLEQDTIEDTSPEELEILLDEFEMGEL